jgi:hypothetical protein
MESGVASLFIEASYPVQAVAIQDGLALESRRSDIFGSF